MTGGQEMKVQDDTNDRWALLRDVLVFQGKLLIDASRDILLSPISLVVALVDVVQGKDNTGQYFYQIILFGRKTERWINLFGSADHLDEERYRHSDRQGVDTLVKQLEGVVLQEYERGGITTKTKNAVDFALDNVLLKFQKSPDNDTSESSGKE